jgi:peptide/nickel transport system ATP-binding protein
LHGVVFDILVGSENHVGSAVPVPQPGAARTPMILKGDAPSPINPPSGCRFHTRCPFVFDRCRTEEPKLRSTGDGQWVACHLEALPEERDPLGDSRQAQPISTPVE